MNEAPKDKTPWRIGRTLLIWLALFLGILLIIPVIAFALHVPMKPHLVGIPLVTFAALGASLWFPFVGLVCFARWLKCWHNARRTLLALAVLATLATTFYTEEYWRGKRAWDNYRHELEAKGAVLDWEKLIPSPVPDDQNFFMAGTNIGLRFVKAQSDARSAAAAKLDWLPASFKGLPSQHFSRTNEPVVAEIVVMTSATPMASNSASLGLQFSDPALGEKIQGCIKTMLGRGLSGVAGFYFSEYDVSHLPPAQIFLAADATPSISDLKSLIPIDLATNIGQLKLEATIDPKLFQVKLTSGTVTPAADYLRWGDQFTPAFDEVRAALKRPYALIPGDYSEPYFFPIPNFVTMRWLAQSLAQRVQCHLLLGEPEKAIPDLTLIHDSCRILEHIPSGRPMTLVEAMINVAITGLYTDTIKEGLRSHCWSEPDLATLQAQFKEINLGPYLNEAFRDEEANTVRLGERANFEKLLTGELFGYDQKKSFLERTESHLSFGLLPQGWIFQNLTFAVEQNQRLIDSLDQSGEQVYPQKIDRATSETVSALKHHSIFHLLANIAIPNFTKALQTYAHNQTVANEGQIVCALERYRLAHGTYPETLDALIPQFMDQIPTDLIGGGPLHYHRTDDGKFLLYSIGWNETDDGGTPGTLKDAKQGDWVWQ